MSGGIHVIPWKRFAEIAVGSLVLADLSRGRTPVFN